MTSPILKNRNLLLYLGGAAISLFGDVLLETTLAIYILEKTGSSERFAAVMALAVFPRIILGPIGGAVADRVNRVVLAIWLDIARAIIPLLLVVLSLKIEIPDFLIYGLVLFFALCECFFRPSVAAIIPSVVDKSQLVESNAITRTVLEGATVLAPFVGAFIYEMGGIRSVLIVDALTFGFSAFCLAGLRISMEKWRNDSKKKPFFIDIFAGFHMIWSNRELLSLVTNGLLTHLVLTPFVVVGIPVILLQYMGAHPTELGVVRGLAPAGHIAAGLLLVFVRKHIRDEVQGIWFGLLAMAFMVVGLFPLLNNSFFSFVGMHASLRTAYLGLFVFVMFVSFGFYGVFFGTFYQRRVLPQDLGKFSSAFQTGIYSAQLTGFKMYGYLFALRNMEIPIAVLGTGMLLKVLVHVPLVLKYRKLALVTQEIRAEP